jgi:hypothetical protein
MYITLFTTAAVGRRGHYVKLSTRLSVLQYTVLSLTFVVFVHTNILVAKYTQSAVGFYMTSVVKLSLFSRSVTFLPWSYESVWVTVWNNMQATNETHVLLLDGYQTMDTYMSKSTDLNW